MGHRTGLDGYGKSLPHRDSIPDRPARSESLYQLSHRGSWSRYYRRPNDEKLSGNRWIITDVCLPSRVYKSCPLLATLIADVVK